MVIKQFILFFTVTVGSMFGWWCGSAGGIMGSYFTAVIGASAGLFVGRKIQRRLGL